MTTKWNGKVHPLAEKFPLLDAEGHALLVESIRQSGVREPITIGPDGTLYDGRNRARAAQDAGVDPPVYVEHGDVITAIRDSNLRRRHMSTGQQAMVEALLLEEEGKRVTDPNGDKRWQDGVVKRGRKTAAGWEVAMKRAGNVLDHAPDLVEDIVQGKVDLTQGWKEATRREKVTKGLSQGTKVTLRKTKPSFNHVNENIGWAAWSWNPVTGCEHGCPYCYARPISESLMRQGIAGYERGFEPAFHEDRLEAPANTTFPADPAIDARERRVFVCSMADLFGRWVPQEWIDKVFDACQQSPQWEYLFLTKFPNRYAKLDFPPDAWAGTSVDTQKRVTTAMRSMEKCEAKIRWLSIEPLLEPLTFPDLSMFNLIVIGAQTAVPPTKEFPAAPAVAPDFNWVVDLVAQARRDGCSVYLKENLVGDRNDQAPGMTLPQELPS